MRQMIYVLQNKSKSEGTYLFNGDYLTINPGERIELTQKPTNWTNNVLFSVYTKQSGKEVILRQKQRKPLN